MFSKPKDGWTSVFLKDEYLGEGSYLQDILSDVLYECRQFLRGRLNGYHPDFNLTFDEEGSHFGIVTFNYDVYLMRTGGGEEKLKIELLDFFTYKEIPYLCEEIYNDFENHFEEWVKWDAISSSEVEAARIHYRKELLDLRRLIQLCKDEGGIF